MERIPRSPWTWQDRIGFVQSVEVVGATRVLNCSGQVSFDPDGATVHPFDMRQQLAVALENLEAVLTQAGFGLGDIVKMTTFVTDIDEYLAHREVVQDPLDAAGCRYAHTLIGVSALARPEIMVEIDVTAYR